MELPLNCEGFLALKSIKLMLYSTSGSYSDYCQVIRLFFAGNDEFQLLFVLQTPSFNTEFEPHAVSHACSQSEHAIHVALNAHCNIQLHGYWQVYYEVTSYMLYC